MTIHEAKQLEVKLANNILNNIPFAQAVQILSNEATRRAKEVVDNGSEEELTKMEKDFEKVEAELAAQQKSNERTEDGAAESNEEQDKIDLPDGE